MYFDMRHPIYFHALLKSPSKISIPYVKVGNTRALSTWDLRSQHVPRQMLLSLKCTSMLSQDMDELKFLHKSKIHKVNQVLKC